jgi:HPr kinase/phosphorylase
MPFPELLLTVSPGRNLAVLVEAAVAEHMLRMNGYNASVVFAQRQAEVCRQGGV